jgi:hypothetical protein
MAEQATDRLVRVSFDLNSKEWPSIKTESLWAEELDSGEYLVRNSPFYVYGISTSDIVFARSADGVLTFAGVAKRGGHSTYRILLKQSQSIDSPQFLKAWKPLEYIGCTYELAKSRWLAVDVPPETDIFEAYRLLEQGELLGVWTFEEAHCGHSVNK